MKGPRRLPDLIGPPEYEDYVAWWEKCRKEREAAGEVLKSSPRKKGHGPHGSPWQKKKPDKETPK